MEKELEQLIEKIHYLNNGDLLGWSNDSNIKKTYSDSPDSTAVRTLLSDEFYPLFRNKDDYYKLANHLSNHIYSLYYQDSKTISFSLPKLEEFIAGIKKEFLTPDFFWRDEYWHYDQESNRVRKESRKKSCENGYFYIKEIVSDGKGTPFQNIEVAHAKHTFNPKATYSYIYGRLRNDSGYTLRFYFNFLPDGPTIVELLKKIQIEFDNNQIPFEFKFFSDPKNYITQNHTGVLYVPRTHTYICFALINIVYKYILGFNSEFFCDSVPMFTCKMAKGLSFGEEPDDRRFTSFGQCRSILIAIALVKAKYITDSTNIKKEVVDFLVGKGFDLHAFYCNPNSRKNYEKERGFFWSINNSHSKRYQAVTASSDRYLDAAITFAEKICKEAIWRIDDNSDCHWIQFNDQVSEGAANINIFEKMDDSLLNGRMGIAYFLYQLHKVNRNNTWYRTAYYTLLSVCRKELSTRNDINWSILQFSDRKINKKCYVRSYKEKINKTISFDESFEVNRLESAWRGYKLDDVLISPPNNKDKEIADEIIENFISNDISKPFGNGLGNTEINFSLTNGYAFLGYYFLRMYRPFIVPVLPMRFKHQSK